MHGILFYFIVIIWRCFSLFKLNQKLFCYWQLIPLEFWNC